MPDLVAFTAILPPLLAIALAIFTRQVFLSLLAGVWVGYLVLAGGAPLTGTLDTLNALVAVFADAGNTRVILFCIMVGSLIALMGRSGGFEGFIDLVQNAGIATGRRSAGLLAMAVGMIVFIESSTSCLVTGTVVRPIFDKLRISREKLAYICDSTSAPTCIMIPLNGWGAFVLAQLAGIGVDEPLSVFASAIPLNFYAIGTLLLLLVVLVTGWDFGPMRRAERRAREEGKLHADDATPMIDDDVLALAPDEDTPCRALNMLLPMGVLIMVLPLSLLYTGYQNLPADLADAPGFWDVLRASSGSTSVFYAVIASLLVAGVSYRLQGLMTIRESVDVALRGAGSLLPLGLLMMFAFALGKLCGEDGLGTGPFVASLIPQHAPAALIAPLIFIAACFIAFATGTSWGTFAIMLPLGVSIAGQVGLPQSLAVSAVLGGGVFGDHCSPISDTTIVASMASASDHIDHVRTQYPYAMAVGVVAAVLYAVTGAMMAK